MSNISVRIKYRNTSKYRKIEEDIWLKKIKVCIVDDNRELVALLEEYISEQPDMEVIGVAHNGQDCLSMLEQVSPDVLVLDIIMPHLDGLAVLERIKE